MAGPASFAAAAVGSKAGPTVRLCTSYTSLYRRGNDSLLILFLPLLPSHYTAYLHFNKISALVQSYFYKNSPKTSICIYPRQYIGIVVLMLRHRGPGILLHPGWPGRGASTRCRVPSSDRGDRCDTDPQRSVSYFCRTFPSSFFFLFLHLPLIIQEKVCRLNGLDAILR